MVLFLLRKHEKKLLITDRSFNNFYEKTNTNFRLMARQKSKQEKSGSQTRVTSSYKPVETK